MIKNETHPNNIVTDALDASRAGDTSILAEGMEFGREKRQSTASEEIGTSDSNMLASRTKRRRGRPRLGVSQPLGKLREIDTSWKDGRSIFPKRSSQVGARYQVDFLPPAGTVETEKHLLTETKYDLIWSSKKAAEKGVLNFIEENVPPKKREKALQLIHNNDYCVGDTDELIHQIDETNKTANWTRNEIEKFNVEIFRCRKNFKSLSRSLEGKNMGDIIAFYLGHYKKSDEYRHLKTVLSEEKRDKAERLDHDAVDQCAICGEGGNLIICDGCESEWHLKCTKPMLKRVPEGRWECDVCIDRKFIASRKRILKNIKTNLSLQKHTKKAKLEHTSIGSEQPQETKSENYSIVTDTLKVFAKNIDSILTKPYSG